MMLALLLALQAPPAEPPPDDIVVRGKPYGKCGPRYAPLYVAPMGEPFRTNGTSDPMARWVAQADADHDGRVTRDEMIADALRFFATIDTDHDGELDPQEVSAYEIDVAPEIRLHQAESFRFDRPPPRRARDKRKAKEEAQGRADYATPYGAGINASLNIPEPVASADLDIDRGVSRDEFAKVAAQRFMLLDEAGGGYLSYQTMAKSPAQAAIDACYAKEAPKRQ